MTAADQTPDWVDPAPHLDNVSTERYRWAQSHAHYAPRTREQYDAEQTPDPHAALIADAFDYAGVDEYPGAILLRSLADALVQEKARADEAQRSRAAYQRMYEEAEHEGDESRARADKLAAIIQEARTARAHSLGLHAVLAQAEAEGLL